MEKTSVDTALLSELRDGGLRWANSSKFLGEIDSRITEVMQMYHATQGVFQLPGVTLEGGRDPASSSSSSTTKKKRARGQTRDKTPSATMAVVPPSLTGDDALYQSMGLSGAGLVSLNESNIFLVHKGLPCQSNAQSYDRLNVCPCVESRQRRR